MKPRILSVVRLSFPLASAIAALLAASAPKAEAQLFYKSTTPANSWTGNFWGTSGAGPFTGAWVSGSNVTFVANGGTALALTGATTQFASITADENVNVTASGTLGTGGTVATVTVATGKNMNFGTQVISTAAGTGFIKNGAGTLTLTGGAYAGGFTLNAGTVAMVGVNAMGDGGALTINGGTIRSNLAATARDLSGKYDLGITIGGDFTLGDAILNGALTFTDNVALGASTRNITVSSTVTLGGILSGSPGVGLTKSGAGALTLNGANTYDGATTLNAGTLVLNGANATGGTVTLNAGTLSLGNLNAIQNATGITMADTSTLRPTILGPFPLSVPITTSGSVTIGAPTVALGNLAFNEFILNGAIGGSGNVTFNNTTNANQIFTVTLAAANTYSGGTTTINNTAGSAGQMFVKLGVENALPTTTVLSILGGIGTGTGRGIGLNLFGFNQTLAGLNNTAAASRVQEVVNSDASAAATLTINGTTNSSYSGNLGRNFQGFSVGSDAIPGSTNGNNFSLTKNGSGTFAISGNNTFRGATTILGGILSLGTSNALSQSPLDTLSSVTGDATNGLRTTVATLTMGGLTGNKDLSSVFTITSGAYNTVTALTLNPVSGATPSYSGAIADGAAGMTLTKTGAGTQTLGGANTFTGATALNAGTLTLDYSTQDNSKLSDTAALTLGTGTLDLSGGTHLEVVVSTTLAAGTASKVTRSSGTAMLEMNAITQGALASIDFSNAGIATTDTLNNAYGILGPWATIGGTDFAVNSTNGPDGLITAPTNTDVARLDGTPALQIIADSPTSNVRIVEGSGSPANITLGAATTTINTLTQSASGGASAAMIDSGTQTLLTNAILLGTGAGDLNIGNGTLGAATAGGDLSLVNTTASGLTVSSVIANNTSASTLSKLGTGTVTLTNANTYTGATTISAGSLQLGAGGTTGSLDITSPIILANSGNLAINRSNAVTQGTDFSTAAITGTGSITQAGSGTTTLNAINTYSGPTTISAGILNANSTDALGSGVAGNTLVFNGGTLQAGGIITSPSTRAVNLNSTAVIDTNGNAVSFAGSASGVGGLTKNGAGTLTSSAFNTFTGPITINGGELVFSGSGGANNPYLSTQININNGSTLRITGTSGNQPVFNGRNYTFDATGGGSILLSTGNYNAVSTPFSITTLGGAANTIGLITTSGVNGFNLGVTTCTFDVALGSDATSDLTVTPIVNNSGSVVKTGAGRLTFTGANTYSGGTTINGGTLRLVGGSAIAGIVTLGNFAGATLQVVSSEGMFGLAGGGAIGGSVSIDAAQTLSLASGSAAQTYAGTVSGAGTLANTGATQTLNGVLSHTGGVNVTLGALTLGNSGNTYPGITAISAAAAGVIVTANGALGATGTGNGTTVGAAGALGFSGGVNYSTAETITGSGSGNATSGSPAGFTIGARGFIQSVNGNNTFAGNIELSANGNSRIGTQDGAQLTLTGPITQASGITTANILFRVGNLAGDFVTLAGTGNSFGGDSTVFTTLATPGQYAGLRIGIDNGHPTNLTVQNFSSASGSSTALDLNGNDQALNGLANGGAGTMNVINLDTVNASTLTLNPTVDKNSGANILILGGSPGGTPLGVINVVKDGTFNQTLSAANSHTGTTTVNNGTLTLGNATALGTGSASVAGGSLSLGGQTITNAVSVGAAGTLTGSGGTGAATLAGALTPGGPGSGLITMASATVASTSAITLQLPATGTRGTNYDAITVSGALALDGTITVDITGLTPSAGQSFDLIDAAGSIDVTAFTVATDLVLPALGGGLVWDTSAFATTGVVSIANGDPFPAWAALKGLTGAPGFESGKADDPDKDGRTNLDEFAFDGDPLSGANDGKVVGKIATVGADQVMTLTLPVRSGASFLPDAGTDQLSGLIDGIYYRIEGSLDLATFANAITEVTGGDAATIQTGLPGLSTGWTYRTFRAPGTVPTVSKTFLRAKVSETP